MSGSHLVKLKKKKLITGTSNSLFCDTGQNYPSLKTKQKNAFMSFISVFFYCHRRYGNKAINFSSPLNFA